MLNSSKMNRKAQAPSGIEPLLSNQQKYVERFTLTYCIVVMGFSAFFTPQDFNFKVALIVNLLLFLIGAPYWFRNSKVPKTALNVVSQVSNTLASIWICSFLGPTSHANLVSIPQFILVLMMFKGRSGILTAILGATCVFLLSLPLFPFVNTWYLHKRMTEENLVILRFLLDLSVLGLTTHQAQVITRSWRDANLSLEQKSRHLEKESLWRARLIRILSHDIKEPIIAALQLIRKIRKDRDPSQKTSLLNQLENSQLMIREIISNVESYSSSSEALELPLELISFDEVLEKLTPWIKSRVEEKNIRMDRSTIGTNDRFLANPESLSYQVILNLLSNAIKFSHPDSEITLSTRRTDDSIEWIIRDQGKGIPNDAFSKEGFSETGTDGESGSGLGMRIARLMSERQSIRIQWSTPTETESRIGTEVILSQKSSHPPS